MRQNQGSEAVASAYGRNLGTKYGAEDAPAIVMTEGRGRSPLTNSQLTTRRANKTEIQKCHSFVRKMRGNDANISHAPGCTEVRCWRREVVRLFGSNRLT
jgi:hypothetical protein